jgi:hypothetical protein
MERRHQQKSALILKYAKRCYDGGPEIDLIRNIERQNQTDQMNRMYHGANKAGVTRPECAHPQTAGTVPFSQYNPAQVDGNVAQVQFSPVAEAVLMGPLQVAVGLVGMLTAGLAILTFSQAKNEGMVQQSKQVFSDCAKTFKKGLWDTLCTPVRVFKASRRPKA